MTAQRPLLMKDWPPADVAAWQMAIRPGSLLDDCDPAAGLSCRHRDDLWRRYAYFLNFARETGRLVTSGTPAATLSPETVAAYIGYLEHVVMPVTLAGSLWKLHRMAHLLAPDGNWEWLRKLARRYDRSATPRNKRPRVVDVQRLYELGFALMGEAALEDTEPTCRRAIDFRDGLIVALLATTALRMANFAALEIGRTLHKSGDSWFINIPTQEAKSRRAIEMSIPAALGGQMDIFVQHYRPVFSGSNSYDHLWPSVKTGPLTDSGIFDVVTRRTRDAFGHSVNPHLFRDCAATSIALRHGARIGIASALLGHRDRRVTEAHYNQAGMIDAVRDYQTVLGGLGSAGEKES